MDKEQVNESCRELISEEKKGMMSKFKSSDEVPESWKSRCSNLPEPMIAEVGQSASISAAAPVIRETMEIRVDGKTLIVYKDNIKKELYKDLYSSLGLQLGS